MNRLQAKQGRITPALVTICFSLLVSLCITLFAPAGKAAQYSAIVVDGDTGRVLHAQGADQPRYPASLTKMMTLYMAFDALKSGRLKPDQQLPVSAFAAGQAPSSIALRPGQTISVRNAILAGVTKSANDAMVVLAEAIGGSEPAFAEMMTRRAHALGMSHTTFRNASGLPNPQQKTTARDMATLALALLRNHRDYYHYFSTPEFEWNDRVFANHNHLLNRYQGVDGIKTGFIRASGFNLVASAKRDGRRVIGVVFGGTSVPARDARMVQLLDMAFNTRPGHQDAEDPVVAEAPGAQGFSLISSARAAETGSVARSARAKKQKTAEPARTAKGKRGKGGAWSVQLGAFSKPQKAKAAIVQAKATVPAGAPSVERLQADASSTLYRARLTGLTEADARLACSSLKRQNLTCTVVSPAAG